MTHRQDLVSSQLFYVCCFFSPRFFFFFTFWRGRRRRQDSAKTRMQTQTASTDGKPMKYTSTLQTLSYVVKNEGFFSLWKGFTPYFARSGTHTVRAGGCGGGGYSMLCAVSYQVIDHASLHRRG